MIINFLGLGVKHRVGSGRGAAGDAKPDRRGGEDSCGEARLAPLSGPPLPAPGPPFPPSPAVTDLHGVLVSSQVLYFAQWFLRFPRTKPRCQRCWVSLSLSLEMFLKMLRELLSPSQAKRRRRKRKSSVVKGGLEKREVRQREYREMRCRSFSQIIF